MSGYLWLTLSAIAGGLGNSLEPVSVLAILHTTFLIAGLHIATWNDRQAEHEQQVDKETFADSEADAVVAAVGSAPQTVVSKTWRCRKEAPQMLFLVLTQAAGFCLGFASIFAYPAPSALSMLTTFVAGLLLWMLFAALSVLPHRCFAARYPTSWAVALTYPLTHTVLSVTVVGRLLSTFPAVGNAVLDVDALKQTASLLGLFGVTFLATLLGTVSGLEMGRAVCPATGTDTDKDMHKQQVSIIG